MIPSSLSSNFSDDIFSTTLFTATGEEHPPWRVRSNERSAKQIQRVGKSSMLRITTILKSSSTRTSIPSAPCPMAYGNSEAERLFVMRCDKLIRFNPAVATIMAVKGPSGSSSLRRRVSLLFLAFGFLGKWIGLHLK